MDGLTGVWMGMLVNQQYPGVPDVSRSPDFHSLPKSSAHLPVPVESVPIIREPQRSLGPGDLLADRYEIRRELEPGIFVALDRIALREVRLVIVSSDRVPMIQKTLGTSSAAGLIRVFDVYQTARACFYTAEIVDGMTLRDDLARRTASEQRFTVDEVRRLGEKLVDLLKTLPPKVALAIDPDTVLINAEGRVRLSESALFAPDTSDVLDCQQQVAALLYELLTGTRAEPGCRSVDQVRGQVPRPFAVAIHRAMETQNGRRFRSLDAFQRALQRQIPTRSPGESLVVSGLIAFAMMIAGLGWWLTRPTPPRFTKADYAQRLGQVQELQQRVGQLDSGLINEAKAAREEIDKWQRELNAAREGNKPAQQEYAAQRLAEVRPDAEVRVQLGDHWQHHQQKTAWQSQATGELKAAETLASEGQYDLAIEHLTKAEELYSKPVTWKQSAEQILAMIRTLQNDLQQRRSSTVAAIPFAYEWPTHSLAGLSDLLRTTDGKNAMETVRKVEAALPEIESLLTLRNATTKAVQETEVLNDVQEIRKQRQDQLARFRQADEQLRQGDFKECRTGYEQTAERLLQLPVAAIELLIATARTSRTAGNIDAALTMLSKALSLSAPSTDGKAIQVQAYLLRAEIRADQKNERAAIEDCGQALGLQPQSVAALLLRAKLFLGIGETERAIADCDAALRIDAESELAYSQRGLARFRKGNLSGALADFDAALRLNPKSVDGLVSRGLVRLELREYALAAEDFHAVLTQQSQHPAALTGRANLLRIQGDFAGAIRDADELLHIQPNSADGYLIRGAARLGLGSLEAATGDLQRAGELNPNDPAPLVFIAQVCNQSGDWKRAIAVCGLALRRDPRCVEALAERGRASLIGGNLGEATSSYSEALKIDPEHAASLLGQADIRLQKNQLAEAMQDYDRVLSRIPDHVAARIGRAAIWLARANYARAIEDCDAALRADPKSALAYRTRAVANSKLARHDQTIADCTSVLLLDGTVAEVYAYRGAAWLEQGDAAKAIEDCDAALQRNPSLGSCYKTRAMAWFKQGDQTRAQADYEMALRLEPK